MEQYIGLDVHSTTCTAVVISPSGRRSKPVVIETRAKELVDWIRGVRRASVLVMEEGNQSDWLYEVLAPHTLETLVAQPVAGKGNKNDVLDAEKLARRARVGEAGRLIFKKPTLLASLRQAAKCYLETRRDRTRLRARLKLLLQSRGLHANPKELLALESREVWIERLSESMQLRARLLGAQIDATEEVFRKAKEWMLEEAKPLRSVHRIRSVPGIGQIRAPLIVATMISPHRFRTKRQLWSYSGLAVVLRSSSDWRRTGDGLVRRTGHQRSLGLNHNRHPVLKDAFVGAAQQIISRMPSHPLHKSYQARLERGMKPTRARLTLARKIASIVLALWKRGEEYDPTKS